MRFTLLLLLSLGLGSLQAQTITDFIQPQANWLQALDDVNTSWSFDGLDRYYLGSDTLVNDTLYRTYWLSRLRGNGEADGLASYIQPFIPVDSSLVGLVRESLGRKVYFREAITGSPSGFGPEGLLYDFSLEEGEEFTAFDGSVYNVVRLYQEERYGTLRRIWELDNGTEIIEGIGSTEGPLFGVYLLVLGFIESLYDYCTGEDMDCHIAVDRGLVHPLRQINVGHEFGGFREYTLETEQYRFRGDTLIGGDVFLRLFKSTDQELLEWEDTEAYFRQVDERVYRYAPAYDTAAVLIYDFSLTVGDTFSYTSIHNPGSPFRPNFVIEAIDTVLFTDGTSRRAFTLRESSSDRTAMTWVEGIGSLGDFVFPEFELFVYPVTDFEIRRLRCYYNDYARDWAYRSPDSEGESCFIFLVDTDAITDKPGLTFFPNPVQDYVHISGDVENLELRLYNINGQGVGTFSLAQSSVLDIRRLPSATYIYQVWDEALSRVVQRGKWQKN